MGSGGCVPAATRSGNRGGAAGSGKLRGSCRGRERVELGAVRHALAEYDSATTLLTLVTISRRCWRQGAGPPASRPKVMSRSSSVPDRLRRYLQPREGGCPRPPAGMLLTVCWSVQHTGWLEQLDFWRRSLLRAAAGGRAGAELTQRGRGPATAPSRGLGVVLWTLAASTSESCRGCRLMQRAARH